MKVRDCRKIPLPTKRDWLRYFAAVGTDWEFFVFGIEYIYFWLIEKVELADWRAVPLIPVRGYGVATYTPKSVSLSASSLVMCSYENKTSEP